MIPGWCTAIAAIYVAVKQTVKLLLFQLQSILHCKIAKRVRSSQSFGKVCGTSVGQLVARLLTICVVVGRTDLVEVSVRQQVSGCPIEAMI